MKKLIRILIAEDDPDEHFFIREGLVKSGCFEIIEIVANGALLINAVENTEQLPDLILSDINMPLVNGLEALCSIKGKSHLSHIPFVIFTTCDLGTTRLNCLSSGADHFMLKPKFMNYNEFSLELMAMYHHKRFAVRFPAV
jgi:CheY-like chemotaxis protein